MNPVDRYILAALIALVMTGCASAPVVIRVIDSAGAPVEGAKVTWIRTKVSMWSSCKRTILVDHTDAEGRAIFTKNLAGDSSGNWHDRIGIQHSGFQEAGVYVRSRASRRGPHARVYSPEILTEALPFLLTDYSPDCDELIKNGPRPSVVPTNQIVVVVQKRRPGGEAEE